MNQHQHRIEPYHEAAYRSIIENVAFIKCSECGAIPQVILVWPEQISVQVHVLQTQPITPLEKKE